MDWHILMAHSKILVHMVTDRSKKTVLVGLSGGVDSAVSAYILKSEGYDVHAVTYIISDNHKASVKDATDIASILKIPLYIEDKQEEFKKTIENYFIDSYIKGDTPNPCVLCNSTFKFKNLIDKADSMGIDYVATGHYANIKYNERLGCYCLFKSKNERKDQSYFLYKLNQQQLSRILFPIADMNKDEVRIIADKIGLPVKDKKDSQDICFIKGIDYTDFIKDYRPGIYKESVFTDKQGKVLGKGANHIHFTPGQRRGLNKGFNQRMYVIGKNAEKNEIILGNEEDLYSKELILKDINLICYSNLSEPLQVKVKIRNSMPVVNAIIYEIDEGIKVIFDNSVKAAVKGQSAVFYENDRVVGGGIIYDCL